MQLNLTTPLVFIDLETTGVNFASDRIVELSLLKIMPDGSEECKTRRINPQRPIPKEATAIHGITDEDVKDCPTFKEIAKSLAGMLEGCDLAGFNSSKFDIPLLAEEFLRVGVNIDLSKSKFVDVQTIYHKMEPRNLIAAYKFYCGKDLTNAHSAEGDVRATYEVLMSQLDHYQDLENSIDGLMEASSYGRRQVDFAGRMFYDANGEAVFNFGKYKDKTVKETLQRDPGYYQWMMQGDFPLNTKQKLTEIRNDLNEKSSPAKKR